MFYVSPFKDRTCLDYYSLKLLLTIILKHLCHVFWGINFFAKIYPRTKFWNGEVVINIVIPIFQDYK